MASVIPNNERQMILAGLGLLASAYREAGLLQDNIQVHKVINRVSNGFYENCSFSAGKHEAFLILRSFIDYEDFEETSSIISIKSFLNRKENEV